MLDCCKKLVPFIIPLLFCGDEISDILYLVTNWDDFGNVHLKNATIAFICLNLIVCVVAAVILMTQLKGLQGLDTIKILALTLFFGWVPILFICVVMIWSKFFFLLASCGYSDKFIK